MSGVALWICTAVGFLVLLFWAVVLGFIGFTFAYYWIRELLNPPRRDYDWWLHD